MDIKEWAIELLRQGHLAVKDDMRPSQGAHRRFYDSERGFTLELIFRWDRGDAALSVDLYEKGGETKAFIVQPKRNKPTKSLEEAIEKAIGRLS